MAPEFVNQLFCAIKHKTPSSFNKSKLLFNSNKSQSSLNESTYGKNFSQERYLMKKKKLPTTNGTTQIPFLLRLISQIQIDITTYI